MPIQVSRSFVYKCPDCGETVACEADIFSLSDGYVHHCACGQSSASVKKLGGKYRVSVPCGFCGDTHYGTFSMMELVRGNPLFIFCPLNDKYCACAGSTDKIRREVTELETSYRERTEIKRAPDAYWNTPAARHGILQKMVGMIENELMSCVCGGRKMKLLIRGSETFLRCERCGGETAIPTLDGITEEEYPEITPVLFFEHSRSDNVTPINRPTE